eukprot:10894602-Ditylum_brightwellii.AAC.1
MENSTECDDDKCSLSALSSNDIDDTFINTESVLNDIVQSPTHENIENRVFYAFDIGLNDDDCSLDMEDDIEPYNTWNKSNSGRYLQSYNLDDYVVSTGRTSYKVFPDTSRA